jgi:hypothetical protein
VETKYGRKQQRIVYEMKMQRTVSFGCLELKEDWGRYNPEDRL